MKFLVTGGAGYAGSIATERLLAEGHDVVVFDNLWRGHAGAVPAGARLVNGDIRDASLVAATVAEAKPDAVFHFAAAIVVPESVKQPADYFAINTVGSHNLLVAMRDSGVSRIVFSSTAAVYGQPTSLPVRESDPTNPINPYGWSKLMVEKMLEAHAAAYGLRYAALRYFNIAGASPTRGEDHRPESHIIPLALQTALGKRETFRIFGSDYATRDGTAIRDYVHVLDLVDAHLLAIAQLDALGQALGPINLGTRDGFTVREIVNAVERVTSRHLAVEYADRRDGDPPILIADSTRAREILKWTPRKSTLDEMIGSAWDWFQRNPNGYAD